MTKYKVGEKVWLEFDGEIVEGRVIGINTSDEEYPYCIDTEDYVEWVPEFLLKPFTNVS